ncbi:MAG TPA: FmdB family zinc ribbon protein [Rubrobacteraceae bacterium]|nr:FmdB family zinc ribbon protein [Rubrobacteraceae bacterium]
MPIYEYKCENGHVFDVLQSMSEGLLTECIECSAPVRKILHPVGISFKGSGFYSTDYRGAPKAETSDKTAKSGEAGANGASGSEKKPEKTAKKGE